MADKTKLPSRHVSVGPEKAPHRSFYYAMGMDETDIAKPLMEKLGFPFLLCHNLDIQNDEIISYKSVSYTHLTLPTIYSV